MDKKIKAFEAANPAFGKNKSISGILSESDRKKIKELMDELLSKKDVTAAIERFKTSERSQKQVETVLNEASPFCIFTFSNFYERILELKDMSVETQNFLKERLQELPTVRTYVDIIMVASSYTQFLKKYDPDSPKIKKLKDLRRRLMTEKNNAVAATSRIYNKAVDSKQLSEKDLNTLYEYLLKEYENSEKFENEYKKIVF